MRAFVTGLDGFVGQWLARELFASGNEVAGGSRNARPSYSILTPAEAKAFAWFAFDLRSGAGLVEALKEWGPDAVYHLAAQASVQAALDDPIATIDINVTGTARLLEACAAAVPRASLLWVGSADAYGNVSPDELPLRESAPLRPCNPYAASKAAAEAIALQYARSGLINVVATRSFNHTGPGQRTVFAAPAFARQIADIARKRQPPVLRTGNLDAKRDFTDVRDVVRAYRLLLERGESSTPYNVCSGRSVSMQTIVDELIRIADVKVTIEVDPARLRPADVPEIVGDNALVRARTGWAPAIGLEQMLSDLYAWHARA
jgi:GDP-4-dehydro-6-deoxy-D-mannose reductase